MLLSSSTEAVLRILACHAIGFVFYIVHIVGHFLSASLSHRILLTQPIYKCVKKVWSNRFLCRQADNMQKTRANRGNYTKFALDCRHLQANFWFDLHSKQACMHHQYESQQNWCIYIHVRHLWFTNSAERIVKQKRILRTGTFMRWSMRENTPRARSVLWWMVSSQRTRDHSE